MWGTIIVVFALLWVVQIILSVVQMKHYQKTIKEMSKHSSGYLGVGVDKRKLGVGTVVVIVCNKNGMIIDSKKMHGVTVFQRFSNYENLLNMHINKIVFNQKDKLQHATNMAIDNIRKQIQAN
ncbi:transcriptional regulator GutM [Ornithinibacillus sp. 179-J 7C1 HS]|uniref:transcriptional regulator GutM n=1 Tax=Ornithinibacillus sp. 179-J 7C1 HS TaxID=3142384 RepID=UPI0039A33DF7